MRPTSPLSLRESTSYMEVVVMTCPMGLPTMSSRFLERKSQ